MALEPIINGQVRAKVPELLPANTPQRGRLSSSGGELSANEMPLNAEMVRLGNSYWTVLGTPVAPLAALPTTTALLSLWNGEAATGKSYIIDSLFALITTTAAAATPITLAAMLNLGAVSAPTAGTPVPKSLSGKKNYGGKAVIATGATVTNDGWMPIGAGIPGNATSQLMQSLDFNVQGNIIVPPGGMLNLHYLANTTSAILGIVGVRWHEYLLDLG